MTVEGWSRITAISVTHHSAAVIGGCMAAIRSAPNIIVVDNASDDETLEIVNRTVPHAQVINNAIGTGYGTAANLGLETANTEFALMINPDAFLSEDAVTKLLDAADRYPEAGMISPAHRALDGTLTLTHDVGLFQRRHIPPPYDKRWNEPPPEGNLCADFVSGAVNLVRMSAIDKVGGFDSNIFLYYDDDDMCIRMRKAGYSLIHVPSAEVCHIDGGSVRPSPGYVWEKFWNHGWSRLYIERKYQGAIFAYTLGIKHIIRFGLKGLLRALLPVQKNRAKAFRDLARFTGTIAFMLGMRSIDSGVFDRNRQIREQQTTNQ